MLKPAGLSLACIVFLFSTAITSPAQTFTTLASCDATNGAAPNGLVQGTDGNFYGTTIRGGATNPCPDGGAGCGTIFEISPEGALTTLQSFNGTNGAVPLAGLIQGANGTFYGTTYTRGANDTYNGCAGTIFSIVPGGTLVTLYNFCSLPDCADGTSPSDGLIQGIDGNFYGTTTSNGGEPDFCSSNCGTVFKITPAGALTTLYTFTGTVGAGWGPMAALVQG